MNCVLGFTEIAVVGASKKLDIIPYELVVHTPPPPMVTPYMTSQYTSTTNTRTNPTVRRGNLGETMVNDLVGTKFLRSESERDREILYTQIRSLLIVVIDSTHRVGPVCGTIVRWGWSWGRLDCSHVGE
jgi:hypothetical protein